MSKILPSNCFVDFVTVNSEKSSYEFQENIDFGDYLKGQKSCVVFAVPGAFTPTCSAKHLPGFVELAHEIKKYGIESIYCLSVNDRFVMKAWGESTKDCLESGIVLVADGNGEFTKAFETSNDRRANRMNERSQRYAFILKDGVITHFFLDSSTLLESSAENILKVLKEN